MTVRRYFVTVTLVSLVLMPAWWAWAQGKSGRPRVRATPPKWDAAEVNRIFYGDVFAEAVVGQRPDFGKVAAAPATPGSARPMPAGEEPTAPANGGFAWSRIISPTTLEDEVKISKKIIDEEVSTPAKFAGSGYKVARKQFSVLAVLFAIIGEYDGDVRWKADAAAARDLFSRTAGNCKVGTIQVFNESKIRRSDLEDLLSGNGLKDRAGESSPDWSTVADRAPLMQRLEESHEARMKPWIANKGEFSDHSEEMLHEAQLAAALAEILQREGMEDAGDEDYDGYAKRLRDAALDIVDGVKTNNYEKARMAVGEIDRTCTECHQDYRA